MEIVSWVAVAFCIVQTGVFSGLNLAVFSVSRLRLEIEVAKGSRDAAKLLPFRRDSNFRLATIVWGNVATNVLLTLLSASVLTGMAAFLFSTAVITSFGEIIPQTYFARNALRLGALFAPFLKFYEVVLFAVAKPTGLLLNWWLGTEIIALFRERDFRVLLSRHAGAAGSDLGPLEAIGVLNFLDLDDVGVLDEGEPVDPRSIVSVPILDDRPALPPFECNASDPFLRRLDSSGRKWVIFVDSAGVPCMVLDAHHFLRDVLFDEVSVSSEAYWHRPIVVNDHDFLHFAEKRQAVVRCAPRLTASFQATMAHFSLRLLTSGGTTKTGGPACMTRSPGSRTPRLIKRQ